MKILFVDTIHPFLAETLRKKGFTCDEEYDITYNKALSVIGKYQGLVIRSRFSVDKKFIDNARSLRFIARAGSGMENIDVPYAKKKGIACMSSPEGNAEPVGEHALGMLLSLLHNITTSHNEIGNNVWRRKENQTTELKGKTVGIIGYGHTGPAFAERLSGLGVKVLAYDKYKKTFSEKYAKRSTLQDICNKADVLSLHISLSFENYHLFDDEFISRLKKPVILINTSRGAVVDTAALVRALRSGKITGACLDVNEYENQTLNKLDTERFDSNWNYLTKSKNVILTPHIAGQSNEAMKRHAVILARKIFMISK